MKPLEIYIHIPFCLQKCKYCDFLSAPSSAEERQEYVESLCREICEYADLAKAYHVVSIFVGGGTPSILEAEQMEAVFQAVTRVFSVDRDAEITIEMNPGTVTEKKLAAYRRMGINRLSIGLQSVHEEELKSLGRIHTFEDFKVAYTLARGLGFSNINIDLMSGIPGQTERSWEETLREIIRLAPEHISAYSLIIEEGTPFWQMYGEDRSGLPDEETDRSMYRRTKELLQKAGYERYEISNYAKPGYACRHNLGYWERTEYLGFGRGASSFLNECRWTHGGEKEELSREDQMAEYMFLGLRKIEGVSKEGFYRVFGCTLEEVYGKVLEDMQKKNLLEMAGDFVRLTELGLDVSNSVMCEFLL